ncbi:MAG: hypothetical protein IPP72_07560 [Chitinophagaceae bacterium]|nr:hypothetical protein [Chitinophagaceae bacterium]
MKWVLVNSLQSLIQEYHLVEHDKCIMVIKYNPVHHSVRMNCEGNHRLFFIESTGALTGKYIFHNEYDMEIGHMNYDKWFGKEGSVTIESKKYDYQISNSPSGELIIHDSESGMPILNCFLDAASSSAASTAKANSSVENNYLLLGLCWYLSLPVAKEHMVEYAA